MIRTRNQPLEPIPSFAFVNRREVDFMLTALNRLAVNHADQIDDMEAEDFGNLLDAFQTFALSV